MLQLVLDRQGLLSQENNSSSQSLAKYVEILGNQCDRELHLVNDLLYLQRLNAHIYQLELASISWQDWIPQLGQSFQARLQERRLNLKIDLEPNLPPLISDLPSFQRIFNELLNNACKYTPPGEQIIIAVTLQQPNNTFVGANDIIPQLSTPPYFVFSICNSGVEISAEGISRVFEPFYRLPNSDRYKQGGTGLGLALVKKLVVSLNGSIRVESGKGQTCFIIAFHQFSFN